MSLLVLCRRATHDLYKVEIGTMFKSLKKKVWDYIYSIVRMAIEDALDSDSHDLKRQMGRTARDQSALFAFEKIGLNKAFKNRYELINRCLELIPPTGLLLEFGVWKGVSIRHIANRVSPRKVYGFDSFEGLPESWTSGVSKGTFSVNSLPEVPPNAELIKGWFGATAVDFLAQHLEPIAFLHIDSDLYSSAKCVLDACSNRIVPGTVIAFDDFMNYPTWTEGESKAFFEWCQRTGATYEFIGFVPKQSGTAYEGQQVAVRLQEVGGNGEGAGDEKRD
jgi:hypothetical protein